MNAFGDYAGIKKDDLNAGGTISPGFIFYDPLDNLYYGFKGEVKDLAEFERTIVPAVLNSPVVARILAEQPLYLSADNWGYQQLRAIRDGQESGKSQAKFKRIAMEHYLHCMRTKIHLGLLN
jgi:Beta protein